MALVFDLDGVILKTTLAKHAAMLSLFSDYPDRQPAMSAAILAKGGIPRRKKIADLLREQLEIVADDTLLDAYLVRYAAALEYLITNAGTVEGIVPFLESIDSPCYVCSSAPIAEVQAQLKRRNLLEKFKAVYGGESSKTSALKVIANAHPNAPVVFFGDALADYHAACEAQVGFVGVVCELDALTGVNTPKLKNFLSVSDCLCAIRTAQATLNPHKTQAPVSY